MYPWPQRPAGLVEAGFAELARRWRPILDAFDETGVDVCFEIHPGEDLHDGVTFERFLEAVDGHKRANILYDPSHFVLQQLDYAAFIDLYHERIKAFHVKDAEFRPNGRSGVYGGYQSWIDRPGRFRSPGDGQIDFTRIFSKFAQYGYDGWAVLEWECCLKHPEDGAREGAPFIRAHMIRTTTKAFDDFAASSTDPKVARAHSRPRPITTRIDLEHRHQSTPQRHDVPRVLHLGRLVRHDGQLPDGTTRLQRRRERAGVLDAVVGRDHRAVHHRADRRQATSTPSGCSA